MNPRTCLLLVLVALFGCGCERASKEPSEVTFTVGDLISVHDTVNQGNRKAEGRVRLGEGETVTTSAEGRARIVLDSGAVVALDGSTSVTWAEGQLSLGKGRIFVRAERTALPVVWGKIRTKVSGSSLAFDLTDTSASRAYCASGEVTLVTAAGQHRVEAGETASVRGTEVRVLPEKAFEDWTGGLAAPVSTPIAGKSAIPHVRARSSPSDAGEPLVVRSHHVDTKIVGEVAVTRGVTTYFNGSDTSGQATVRLALPEGAMLMEASIKRQGAAMPEVLSVQVSSGPSRSPGEPIPGFEWAGAGWLSGVLGSLPAGESLELSISYAQWLDTQDGTATYRYAMDTDDSVAPVGELVIGVDATETKTSRLSVSAGAEVKRRQLTFRAADVAPQGDFVVELAPDIVQNDKARAYVERTGPGNKDAYFFVRTELPSKAREGVTMAIVVDTSLSVGAGALDTSLAVVDSLLRGMDPEDAVVVIASDEGPRHVGPEVPTSVTPELRAKLEKELSRLRVGGASNLSRGLQRAADLLDAGEKRSGERMVVYIGDGTPTVGEPDSESIKNLLEARPSGMPRLGAAIVGSAPNRWLLGALVQGAGIAVEVRDRTEAARAGAELLAEALTPRYADVTVDLGPHVDRIYPRRSQVVTAGSTVSVIGRLRGPVPSKVLISYRDGSEVHELERPLVRVKVPPQGALEKQWALARIFQIANEGEGIEPAISLAREAGLLTPWTGYLAWAPADGVGTRPFSHRILELSLERDVAFAREVEPTLLPGSTLIEPERDERSQSNLVEAAQAAMRRILDGASRSIRACRDARASVSPQTASEFSIAVTIDPNGSTTQIRIVQRGVSRADAILERCIEGVVKSLPYVPIGTSVSVNHDIAIGGGRSLRPTKCSEASKVSLPVRREIWRTREPNGASDFVSAAEQCELARWSDRQEFLLLVMERVSDPLEFARELARVGQEDAADFVRTQALRQVKSFDELQRMMRILRNDEPAIRDELEKALEKARTDEERISTCRKFLRLAPHDTYARRRLLALLEATGQTELAISSIRDFRNESVLDASLLAEGAAMLLRLGETDEGRRAFGELIERAPNDPWTLAFVGDRLRAAGLYDEAGAAYDSLARLLPYEGAVTLRQALAHAGAGRIDVASRLFERVAQTGGRSDEGRLSDLATIAGAVTLAAALGKNDGEVQAEMERRLLRTALPDAQALVLVRAAPAEEAVRLEISREEGETLPQSAEMDARHLGLLAARVERGQRGTVRLALRRDKIAGPSHPVEATVSVLTLGEPGALPGYSTKTVHVGADGESVELSLTEGRLL